MSQPLDRGHRLEHPLGEEAKTAEGRNASLWEANLFDLPRRHNLSAFEKNRIFLGTANGFLDCTNLSGAGSEGDGRSVVAADLDNDGQLELLVRQAGGGALFLYDPQLESGRGLSLTLLGKTGNRLALGAKVSVQVDDETFHRRVWAANSYRSATPTRLHFGLGSSLTRAATNVDITVEWPSGRTEIHRNVPTGDHYFLREWGTPVPWEPGEVLAP